MPGKAASQRCHQARAACQQRGVVAEGVAPLQRREHGAQRGDAGHVFGAGALAGFLAAAAHQRRVRRAARARTACRCLSVHTACGRRTARSRCGVRGQVQRQLAQRLHAVDHPQGVAAGVAQHGLDAVQVGDDAGFIVRCHRAHQRRARRQRAQHVEPVAAVAHRPAARAAPGPVPSRRFQCARLSGTALCSVAPIRQQVAAGVAARAPLAHRAQGRQHGGLDAFGGAAVEHQPAVARRRARGAALARTLSRSARARRPVAWLLLGLPKPCLHDGHGGGRRRPAVPVTWHWCRGRFRSA